MGTKYSSQSTSGYNATPPADDGSEVSSNQIFWSTIKTKLGDTLKTFGEAINSAVLTALDQSVVDTAIARTTIAGDHIKTINVTAAATQSLGDAATMATGYIVTIKNSHTAAITVDLATGTDTLNGTVAGSYSLQAGEERTFRVNSTADGYLSSASNGVFTSVTSTSTIDATGAITGAAITGSGLASFTNTDDVDLVGVSGSVLVGGDGTGQHIAIDGNEIMSKSDATTAGTLEIQTQGGTVNFGSTTNLTSLAISATAATVNGNSISSLDLGTETATTSGTSVDITSLPAGIKRLTLILRDVSTATNTNPLLVQLGDSGGIEATGYLSQTSDNSGSTSDTTGFIIIDTALAGGSHQGQIVFTRLNASHEWVATGMVYTNSSNGVSVSAGGKTLSAELDRIRITTVAGTDTFDAGSINVLYEV